MDPQTRKPLKKKPTKIDEMTKEQIRQAIIKKRECNSKAQKIVENLLEKYIKEDFFLKCLPDINQSHFEDIIEERAITHLCGHPLCSKTLSERDIPKQKYRISLRTNKVYDITARKSFCSNTCYKAAMHVKKQMLTSPLWYRDYEDIPTFNLLPLDAVGSLGQEVDLAFTEKILIKPKSQLFTSINDFASASLNEIAPENDEESEKVLSNENETKETPQQSANKIEPCNEINNEDSTINTLIQNKNVRTNRNQENESILNKQDPTNLKDESPAAPTNPAESKQTPHKKSAPDPMNIVGEIKEKPERKVDPILTTPDIKPSNKQKTKNTANKAHKKQPAVTLITVEVEKCLAEWFTLDTLLFLFGEEKVKEMVSDKGECVKDYLNNYAKGIFYTSNTYDQYQVLCRKLNMLELEDRRNDGQSLQRETKPLPDYSFLQEDSKNMKLKVKAYFAGNTDVPKTDTNEQTETPTDDNNVTQLPLVDKNSQNALRRKIVCQHLNQVLPDLLRSLSLLTLSISSDVRLIVNTFKLNANNIMFKPIQWTLIAIIIIKLLSLRDRRLQILLEQPTAFKHMQLLLLSYKQDGGYLDRLMSWLTDVDRLLDTDDTQLTID